MQLLLLLCNSSNNTVTIPWKSTLSAIPGLAVQYTAESICCVRSNGRFWRRLLLGYFPPCKPNVFPVSFVSVFAAREILHKFKKVGRYHVVLTQTVLATGEQYKVEGFVVVKVRQSTTTTTTTIQLFIFCAGVVMIAYRRYCIVVVVVVVVFLTLTDPLRIQPWSQDRRNQTKSNRESEMSMESIQKGRARSSQQRTSSR